MTKKVRTPGPPPLTDEEKAQRMSMFLAQKKEQLFQGCLFSLLSNPNVCKQNVLIDDVIKLAEDTAGDALKKMYPFIGEKKEGE